jgi:hypothetical protein
MLISNSRNPALIRQFDLNGAFLGQWGGTTIRFPQQIVRRRSNGNLLVAGFSPPAGVYEFDDSGNSGGVLRGRQRPRGVYELQNGLIMFTDGAGVKVFDPNASNPANTVRTIFGPGNFQYIELYEILPGDVNRNRCVDDADLLRVLFAFGQTGAGLPEDLNGDSVVDDADLLAVLFNFGRGCE